MTKCAATARLTSPTARPRAPAGIRPCAPSPTAQYDITPMATARMVRKNSAPRRFRGTQPVGALMVWAGGRAWVWWVSLIVLGAAILALFAVFEKRRNDVLKLLEEIKRWR